MSDLEKYEDIINLPHYISLKHPRMSIEARAFQFAPFAALKGYEEAIKETERITDKKIEIDEGLKTILDRKLQYIIANIKGNLEVTFTYFIKDEKKDGGKYIKKMGVVKKVDNIKRQIIMNDNTLISIDDILNISGDVFDKID